MEGTEVACWTRALVMRGLIFQAPLAARMDPRSWEGGCEQAQQPAGLFPALDRAGWWLSFPVSSPWAGVSPVRGAKTKSFRASDCHTLAV